jgi:hypothetical protein
VADLEERLREEVLRRVHRLEPSADLPDRIHVQVRRHRRRRQVAAGGLSIGLVAALVLVVAVVATGGSDSDAVITDGGHETPAPTPTTSTSIAPDRPPTAPGIGPDTPISRSGMGPIRAGMTLRQAAEAGGIVITPYPSGPDNMCTTAYIEEGDAQLLAEVGTPGDDPMESVIRVVIVSVEGRTEEGVAIGDPVANLTAAYGPPTKTYDDGDGPGSELLIFESGGYAYSALVGDGKVAVLESGDRAWVGVSGDPGGCTGR